MLLGETVFGEINTAYLIIIPYVTKTTLTYFNFKGVSL